MTRGDRIVIAVVAVLALLAWPVMAVAGGGRGDVVTITGPGGTSTLPLGPGRTVDVEGLTGTVSVRIAGEAVHVIDSSCPDRLCVERGSISTPGAALVCAPNGVSVRIGGDADALDSVVR